MFDSCYELMLDGRNQIKSEKLKLVQNVFDTWIMGLLTAETEMWQFFQEVFYTMHT